MVHAQPRWFRNDTTESRVMSRVLHATRHLDVSLVRGLQRKLQDSVSCGSAGDPGFKGFLATLEQT
jgi:hypothetical protein